MEPTAKLSTNMRINGSPALIYPPVPSAVPRSSDQQLNRVPVTRFSFQRVSGEFTSVVGVGCLNVAISDRFIRRARINSSGLTFFSLVKSCSSIVLVECLQRSRASDRKFWLKGMINPQRVSHGRRALARREFSCNILIKWRFATLQGAGSPS